MRFSFNQKLQISESHGRNAKWETIKDEKLTISFRRVFPSLVSLISPAPPTSLQIPNPNQLDPNQLDPNQLNPNRQKTHAERWELHFDSSFRAEIAFEHILEAFRGIDVHVKSVRLVQHLRVRIQHLQRHRIGLPLARKSIATELAEIGGSN